MPSSRLSRAAWSAGRIGSQISREINNYRGNSNLRYQWNAIENDLRIVANAYRNNNRGGRNGQWPF